MSSTLLLLTVLLQVSTASAAVQPGQAFIRANFDEEARVSFRAWGARSNFEASIDGNSLYFFENGPDGLVLKKAELAHGAVSVASRATGNYGTVLAIPGDPRHLLVGEEGAFTTPAFRAAVLDLEGGPERQLDFAEKGFGGLEEVSPSGRFVTAWVDFHCHTGDRDCFADYLAVVSLDTGKVEYRFHQPVTGSTPLGVGVSWAEGDALVLAKASKSGAFETVLRRGLDGRWRESKAKPVWIQQTPRQTLNSGMSGLTVVRPSDARQMNITPAVLFVEGLGRISLYSAKDSIILVKATQLREGWDVVEAVVLRWKTEAR